MRIFWMGGVLAAALLSGCASVTTGVSVAGASAAFGAPGEHTYAFTRTDAQAQSADYARVETLVRDELAQRGFRGDAQRPGRYRVAIAYATRPASVSLATSSCGRAKEPPCVAVDGPAPLALPFAGRVYRHTLTLSFTDSTTGADVYRVSAAVQDRDPHALAAVPALVRSALARLPYEGGSGWLVKTKKNDARVMPSVVSVKPAASR